MLVPKKLKKKQIIRLSWCFPNQYSHKNVLYDSRRYVSISRYAVASRKINWKMK